MPFQVQKPSCRYADSSPTDDKDSVNSLQQVQRADLAMYEAYATPPFKRTHLSEPRRSAW